MKVEIAPGRFCEVKTPRPPTHSICRLVPTGDGSTLRAVPMEWTPVVPIRRNELVKLGIYISVTILRRLVKAGAVKGSLVTPKQSTICLVSLHEHLQRTRCDGEQGSAFWTRERKAAYTNAFEALGREEEEGDE